MKKAATVRRHASQKSPKEKADLAEYNRKRHFKTTPEPVGQKSDKVSWSYVIQKHAASHLHYDFRLELEGTLKSWAVPKGPCLDPQIKRLAVEVEDHPVAYGNFEGLIPEGEYGGGAVMLWDRGTWEPEGDPVAAYRRGRLKFVLHGEKLQGRWMLVRTRSRENQSKPQWLLIKEQDDTARPLKDGDILEEQPLSVVSHRDLEAITAGKKPARSVKKSPPSTVAASRANSPQKSKTQTKTKTSGLLRTMKETLPVTFEPQLATLTKEAPPGNEWLHEVKFDGYRMLCRINQGDIQLISRNQLDWTARLTPLIEALKLFKVSTALLDGEVVVLRDDGTTDFQALQNAFRDGETTRLHYYVFDLLHLDGVSQRELPLEERKARLAELMASLDQEGLVRYSSHIVGQGADFARQACRLHLEGMISKRRDRPYQSGRGYDWLKVKCVKEEEFVIGGYTEPSGSRQGFGALLLGYYSPEGELIYAGKVGTGFDTSTLEGLAQQLKKLKRKDSPFSESAELAHAGKAYWIEPTLVAQVVYGSRTRAGLLRHAVFLGLREDKAAKEVTLEKAIPVSAAVKRSGQIKHRAKSRQKSSVKETSQKTTEQELEGVRLTSPTKIIYPDTEITKLDLATYYRDIAKWILPYIQHRPLVLVRCPNGEGKECFYQKHPGPGTPEELRQILIEEKNGTEPYVVIDDVAGLISLAQVSGLELHAWGSREDALEKPDHLVFDLDPAPEVPWKSVVDGAFQIRDFLLELGLQNFVKTTGGKGLHLVVPIDRRHEWGQVKEFCKSVATTIVSAAPDLYTANMAKEARHEKIFIDYLRNGRGATAIVPYSPRARSGAPVSTPLQWKELTASIKSNHFTLDTIRQRLSGLKEDPWKEMAHVRQGLSKAIQLLNAVSR